jgi:hypothetical protein
MSGRALTRRRLLALLALPAAAGLAYAALPAGDRPALFTGIVTGVAVGGYDPVAYFTAGVATPGRADITLEHSGAIWRFASPASRDAFRAAPDRFAPRYGGYCAYAVAGGGTSGGDPRYWRIVDGRLYLNASARVHEKWGRDIAGYIAKADANWPAVLKGGW